MSKKDIQVDEDLRKSLQGIFSDEEINDLFKSEDGDKDDMDEDKEDDNKEDEDKEEKEDDTEKSLNSKKDLQKSIQSKLDELKTLQVELKKLTPIEKSETATDDLVKSFNAKTESLEKSFGELKEEFSTSLSDITKSLATLQKSIETIGENSRGMKGHQFSNFIQKSGEGVTEDGFTVLSIHNKEGISQSLLDIMEKSEGSEKEALSSAIMNLECTGVGSLVQNRTAMNVLAKNKIKLGQ
jgi:hypothetical protein